MCACAKFLGEKQAQPGGSGFMQALATSCLNPRGGCFICLFYFEWPFSLIARPTLILPRPCSRIAGRSFWALPRTLRRGGPSLSTKLTACHLLALLPLRPCTPGSSAAVFWLVKLLPVLQGHGRHLWWRYDGAARRSDRGELAG